MMADAMTNDLPSPAQSSLFLDFDGTLVDIAPTPNGIAVPSDLGALLEALGTVLEGRLALVSGRAIASIEAHLPAFRGTIVGGHGAEIRGRDGTLKRLAGTEVDVAGMHAWAIESEAVFSGTRAELKRTGAAMHFRQAPHHEEALRAAAQRYQEVHPDLAIQEAHMTVELRPKSANKADAVAALMQVAPFKDHRPIFAGDDLTDVPAMQLCRAAGGAAISVNGIDPLADIHLSAPADVRRLLQDWIA